MYEQYSSKLFFSAYSSSLLSEFRIGHIFLSYGYISCAVKKSYRHLKAHKTNEKRKAMFVICRD